MARAPVQTTHVLSTIRAVKALLSKLEERLDAEGKTPTDPYRRRADLLRQIYLGGNKIGREELFALLEAAGTNSRWIGQQVKRGFLSVIPLPGSRRQYAVTQRAVRELDLDGDDEEEAAALAKLSEPSFAEDWDSPEDSIYDNL